MLKKSQLALTLGSIITATLILFSSCKKINEATELGGDLIPAVDNISTFDTTISVEAYNDLFTLGGVDSLKEDSTYSHYTYEQFLGLINTDPLFGTTDAQMFFELKPAAYPFTFHNRIDSITVLDSIVLALDYIETYGDTTQAQTITVSEITSEFRADTSYLMRKNSDFTVGGLLGTASIVPSTLDDSVKSYLDTTKNQLRIRLNPAFGNRLLQYDTSGANNAYSSDSVFKTKFKGFALKSTSGKAVMGIDLTAANTKLAIYFKYKLGGRDTVGVDYFNFKPYGTFLTAGSGSHNYVTRNYSGGAISTVLGGTTPDPLVYIQNTPGTFARLKTPALAGLNNRVIHRAELIAEQEYHTSDTMFPAPTYLYLDAYTSSLSKARNIPYDVIFDGVSQVYNLSSFGVGPQNALDASGRVIKSWHFNITRYVQHVVNSTEPVHDLRLFSPLYTEDQYFIPVIGATAVAGAPIVYVNPNPIKGRVRLTGNTGPLDPNPHRMRIRIVYSKI